MSQKAKIRLATPGDVPAISRLVQRAIRQRNAPDYTPEIVERACANFTEERLLARLTERDVFVAEIDGAPVGTVSFALANAKLYSLFIDPGFDRQGLGTRLVGFIEAHAVARGVSELRLSAALPARPFYERLGYRATAFEERPEGSTWLMLKQLVGEIVPRT